MFNIDCNPFVVLNVTPRGSKSEINDAYEDAVLDADGIEQEREFALARQALFTPNERIKAELGYLLEMRPSDARAALKSVTFDQWIGVAHSTFGLSKTNALAEAVATSPDASRAHASLVELLDGWRGIEPKEIALLINEERSISGFGSVSATDVATGLDKLRQLQATQAVNTLSKHGKLSDIFSSILSNEIIEADRYKERFAVSLLDAYAAENSGPLASAVDRVLMSLQCFVDNGNDDSFSKFEEHFLEWDRLAQPLQLVSETKGLDEVHSRDLYKQIRETALDLANNHQRHDDAARITGIAESVFAELPSAAAQLREDSDKLQEIIEEASQAKVLSPLAKACGEAIENLAWVSHTLAGKGFGTDAPDPVGAIRRSFEDLLTADVPREVRDAGALMLRGLSVELFNARDDALNSKALLSFLIVRKQWFSKETYDLIVDDELMLTKKITFGHLQDAMEANKWKDADKICTQLIAMSLPSEIPDLEKIQKIIREKIRSKVTSFIVWGGIAAVVVGLWAFDGNDSSSFSPSSYENEANVDSAMADAEAAGAAMGEDDYDNEIGIGDGEEELEIAPNSAGGSLSLPQLRYCLRQSARLDAAEPMVDSYQQQSKYNSAVSDFNSRCSSFRYDNGDMARVRSEISRIGAQLRSEAAEIVGPSGDVPRPTAPAIEPEPYSFEESFEESSNPYGETDGY